MNRLTYFISLMIVLAIMFSCVSTQGGAKKISVEKMSGLVKDLVINDSSTINKWKIMTNLQQKVPQFSDRAYLVEKLPKTLAGSAYLLTPADGKKFTGEVIAALTAADTVDVYVAHDVRIAKKPDWLSQWQDTGEVIVNSEVSPTSFGVFKRSFNKGDSISLGANGQSSGCLMYMVLFSYPGFEGVIKEAKIDDSSIPSTWPGCLSKPDKWYSTEEGIRVADNLLLYQYDTGGWGKNIDMAEKVIGPLVKILENKKKDTSQSTIDNDATTLQILFLSKAYTHTKKDRFKQGALKGIDYLLEAQYDNGGWPQYYPVDSSTYFAHITYNDDAIVNVLNLFERILEEDIFAFVDQGRKDRIRIALDKGLDVILKTQIVTNGEKSAWCAQHYADTLLPAPARSYELESISGHESVGVIRYLMSIENPSAEVIDAVQSAVNWFDKNSILGISVIDVAAPDLVGGKDRIVVENKSAPPIWGRFNDIETNKPFFCGRDGVKKEKFSEIEHERRMGYRYHTSAPLSLLIKDYPLWQKKYAPEKNVVEIVVNAIKVDWQIYDASVLPSENDPVFYESNTKGLKGESTIIDDKEIPGNKLLQFISPEGKDNKLCWANDFNMNLKTGATIVFRVKALEGYAKAMAFDIEVRAGAFRDRLVAYEDGTIKLDKAKVRGNFDGKSWNIVRIAITEAAEEGMDIKVYLNEEEKPVLSGVSKVKHGDNKFRFADGSGNDYAASLYDWVVWNIGGAFGPGTKLPKGLTGLSK